MNFTHLSLAWRRWSIAGLACAGAMLMLPAQAANNPAPRGGDTILDAREALKRGDRARLASLRAAAINSQNPLAMWVDYWELSQRLLTAAPNEVSEFYARWPDTYVEDRLRNDWLLQLGQRREAVGDEGIARVLALQHRGQLEAVRQVHRHVFQRMHREVRAAVFERRFQFLD